MMTELAHERLDAYKASIDFLAIADEVSGSLPKGRAYLADQLRRAATSIALNIAEGAGEFAARDKARFYRMRGDRRRNAPRCWMSALAWGLAVRPRDWLRARRWCTESCRC